MRILVSNFFFAVLFFHLNLMGNMQSCQVCSLATSADSRPASTVDICKDLYSSTCNDSNGKNKFENLSNQMNISNFKTIDGIRNRVVRQLGFHDMNDLIRTRLSQLGLQLQPDITNKDWTNFLGSAISPYEVIASNHVFKGLNDCEKDFKSLNTYKDFEENKRKRFFELNNELIAQYQSELISFYADDLSYFYHSHIEVQCYNYETIKSMPNLKNKAELEAKCSRIQEIEKEAEDLFRKRNQENYNELSVEFVKKNLIPFQKIRHPTGTYPDLGENEEFAADVINDFTQVCTAMNQTYSYFSKKIVQEAYQEVQSSKPMIEGLIDEYYSPPRIQRINSLFSLVKTQFHELVNKFVKDQELKARVKEGLDKVEVDYLRLPDNSHFIMSKNNVEVLNPSARINSYQELDHKAIYLDPSLKYFFTSNAFSMPSMRVGILERHEHISIYPALLNHFANNPFALITILSHELSHRLGPERSRIEGFDLSKEYNELFNCYRGPDSIGMSENQREEALSDYMASEILASLLQSLDASKKGEALRSAMQFFCSKISNDKLMTESEHPMRRTRVNGIFASNPHLKKVMGCEGVDNNYKECGLRIDLIENLTNTTSTKHSSDPRGTSR